MDKEIIIWFSQHHNKVLDAFSSLLSLLGEGMFIWIVLLVLILYQKKEWFYLKVLPWLIVGGWLFIRLAVQNVVKRTRPYLALDLKPVGYFIPQAYSFPSLHAFTSFLMATILSYLKPKQAPWFYLLAFLIALSRVYNLVHYGSDVFAGAVLGVLWGLMTILIMKRVFKK